MGVNATAYFNALSTAFAVSELALEEFVWVWKQLQKLPVLPVRI